MSTKTFCDNCRKELAREEEQYDIHSSGGKLFWKRITFCADCFKKHWKGKFPKEKE